MFDSLLLFTPERWEAAKRVLAGETDTGISWAAAARAAEVSVNTLRAWVRRSRQRRDDDDPMIYEIAEFCDEIDELRAGRVQDVMWERAIKGWEAPIIHKGEVMPETQQKIDNRLLTRVAERYDRGYSRNRDKGGTITIDDATEIQRRLLAGLRLAQAKEAETIELRKDEYEVVGEMPLDEYEHFDV